MLWVSAQASAGPVTPGRSGQPHHRLPEEHTDPVVVRLEGLEPLLADFSVLRTREQRSPSETADFFVLSPVQEVPEHGKLGGFGR